MIRSFDTTLGLDEDGMTVLGRIVPIGVVGHIREPNPLTGELEDYDEVFLPGCTERIRQVAERRLGGQPRWIDLTLDHRHSLDHRVGFCTSLSEAADGVDAGFKLADDDDGRLRKVRSMLRESHSGLSIEFDDHVPPIIDGRLRSRRAIDIFAVSATPVPAYEAARVLSVRAVEGTSMLATAGTPNLDRAQEILASMPSEV